MKCQIDEMASKLKKRQIDEMAYHLGRHSLILNLSVEMMIVHFGFKQKTYFCIHLKNVPMATRVENRSID